MDKILPSLFVLLLFFGCSQKNTSERPPNFVILFCDDLGYGDLNSYGHPVIRTPNLDKMADEGVRFTNFYSASPACTASRYSLLTGRYPAYSGFDWVLYPKSVRGIHPLETTIAERLQEASYATGAFGKWHLGVTDSSYLPLQNGFDEYLGLPYSNDMLPPRHPEIPLMQGNDTLEVMPDQATLTRRYTEQAIEFIERHQDEPFFVYLPYAMPHVPLHPGPEFAGQSERGPYGDVVEEIDWSAGEIRKTLEELGLAENTLVFFTSDNGPWIIKGEDGGSSGPLRDGKGSTWEGGTREPAIAWWPGNIEPGRKVDALSSTLDLYPTLLQLAGISLENYYPADGKDITPLLLYPDSLQVEKPFFYHGPGNRLQAVRSGKWKLHIRTNSQTGKDYFNGELPLLFDLSNDIGESNNLSGSHSEIVEELLALLEEHQNRLDDTPDFFKVERQNQFSEHIAYQKPIQMTPAPNSRFGTDSLLTDGLPGDAGDLQTMVGVEGQGFQATIDLGQTLMAERLRVDFLHLPNKWVFLPTEVEFFISTDNQNFKSRGVLKTEDGWKEIVSNTTPYEVLMRAQPLRYIKVVGRNRETCPPDHPGAGKPAWVMAGEIWVE